MIVKLTELWLHARSVCAHMCVSALGGHWEQWAQMSSSHIPTLSWTHRWGDLPRAFSVTDPTFSPFFLGRVAFQTSNGSHHLDLRTHCSLWGSNAGLSQHRFKYHTSNSLCPICRRQLAKTVPNYIHLQMPMTLHNPFSHLWHYPTRECGPDQSTGV